MKHAPTVLPLLLAMALPCTMAAAGNTPGTGATASANTESAPAIGIADRFLTLLDAGDHAGAHALFDDSVAKSLSSVQLGEVWNALPRQFGALRSRGAARLTAQNGQNLVFYRHQFANAALDALVAVDARGRVSGFRILPAAAQTPPTPLPVADSAFSERMLQIGDDATGLPATLTLPAGDGLFPAVVLVHGSGPHDRDESIGPNKPFRDLAHGLARDGIAVLRYEKRTKARPQDFAGGHFTLREETVDDAAAALALLRRTPGIDAARVFVLGHSLGGYAAPMIARQAGNVRGLVLLAANARDLHDIVPEQVEYLAELDDAVTEPELQAIAAMRAQRDEIEAMRGGGPAPAKPMLGLPETYWRGLLAYDPVAEAKALKLPMLLVQGERDYQVTVAGDLARWQKGLSGRADVRIRRYPALNHLLMPGQGRGNPQEYLKPAQVDAAVIADIAAWIKAH